MKKRILSCLMALALCLTLLPTAALAEETEGTAQTSPAVEKAADPANGGAKQEGQSAEAKQERQPAEVKQEGQSAEAKQENQPAEAKQEGQPAEAKQENQPAEAKQENQPAEAKQESQPAEQEEQQEDSAAKQAVAEVQAMIDALPDAADLDGMDDAEAMEVYEAFQTACEAYYDTLSEKQQAQLKNTEKLAALSERFSQLETLAAGEHQDHGVCGKSDCAEDGHGDIDFNMWLASSDNYTLEVGGTGHSSYGDGQTPDSNGKYVLKGGNYYLKTGKDVTIEHPIQITGTVTICLNGRTIQSTAADQPVFEVVSGTLTLTDCQSNQGKVTHFSDGTGCGVEVNGGTFNMYGGSITKNTAAKGGGVKVTSGTVNMYGGAIADNKAAGSAEGTGNGGGVYMSGGTFHMRGGSITGNTTEVSGNGEGNGGGVYVAGGTFNLYDGGSITNNKVIKYSGQNRGGGVHVGDYGGKKGTFNLYGGEISNNEAEDGGGVYVYDGTFTMSGGKITGNTAKSLGGGVCVYDGTFTMSGGEISGNNEASSGGGVSVDIGTFTMSGGKITGNTATKYGGGVHMTRGTYGTLNVSGTAVIKDNQKGTAANNVHLFNDKFITVNGALADDASIGVTTEKTPDAGGTIPIATATTGTSLDDKDAAKFQSDKSGYAVSVNEDKTGLVLVKAHTHYLCGNSSCNGGSHGAAVTFATVLTQALLEQNRYTLSDGTYYLSSTLSPAEKIEITGTVTICLNGQTIQSTKDQPVFEIASGGKLTLTDCTSNPGTVTHSNATGSGVYVLGGGTFDLYGGKISGNKVNNDGGGVCVAANGEFNMHGGEISGNIADTNGGGVYVYGKFTMNGGAKISGNTAAYGGGVYVYNSGEFNMRGGSITNNKANKSKNNSMGGGVYVYGGGTLNMSGGTFNMSGGEISVNTATSNGGGVYVGGSGSTFTMNGNASITGNTAKNGGGVGVYSGATFEMKGTASITDNTAQKDSQNNGGNGGGVYEGGGTFNMSGGEISVNTATSNGGGVYVGGGEFNMSGGTIGGAAADKANKAKNGGGVYEGGGTFNMSGGSITSNHAADDTYGGGVYVDTHGTFNMSGTASITNNTAKNGGGGVYVSGGKFTMSGGSITGNDSNGVFVDDHATFTVSGAPTVIGNTRGGAASNVFLTWGAKITIGTGGLNCPDGSIGVTKKNLKVGDAIATGATGVTLPDGIAKKFKIDKGGYIISVNATKDKLVLAAKDTTAETHTHCLCGKTHTAIGDHQTEQEVTFATKLWMDNGVLKKGDNAWGKGTVKRADSGNDSSEGYVLTTGSYYLENDLTLSGAAILIGGDVKLCLNGHTIDRANGNAALDYVIRVLGKNAHLTLTDCMGGGKLTGGKYGGVDVFGGCALDMFGGTITGNEFNGGVDVGQFGTFNLYGGKITGNSAGFGGGVYTYGKFTMSGGSITNNTATEKGGGVLVGGGTFTVSGNVNITNNTVNNERNNVYLSSGKTITIGEGGLSGQIGVTTEPKPAAGKPVKVIAATKGISGLATHVVSDDNAYATAVEGSAIVLKVKGDGGETPAEHTHTYGDWSKDGTNHWHECTDADCPNQSESIKDKAAHVYTDDADTTCNVCGYIRTGTTETVPVSGVALNKTSTSISVGNSEKLTATVEPNDATNKNVTWTSSDTSVATVAPDGTVTAVKAGTATITATAEGDTGKFATCTVTVTGSSTGGNTGGSSSGGGGGSSSGGSDSNPIIKTETKNNTDGSTTKTETRRDGSVTQTTTGKDGSVSKTETKPNGSSVTENKGADGSTGTVKTDKNGQTEAKTALSNKAVEDAKKSGEAVKAPVEVKASRDSSTAPTVKVELPKGAGETKVEIPVSNVKSGTVAVLVHPDGTEEILKNSIPTEDGIQLTVDGNATVKIVDNSKGFIDTQDHWAEDAIDFVSARGLVNGMSATIYAPNNSTTRAQLWTILARQNDADLAGGSIWYEKAQNWAKDKGVSDGANPNAAINRAQMVTMLWRAVGQPAAGGTANFTDVSADSYYAQAVAWAIENGITTGVGGGKFDPTGACTRAQIAAFLARLYAEK